MSGISMLKNLREELSTYNDFSEIKYKTKYIAVFERVFGKDHQFTKAAENMSTGWNIKGQAEVMCGGISHEQFMNNIHVALVNLLDEAIGFLEMDDKAEEMEGEDVMKNKVFIVHGHDGLLKYQLSDWLRKIGIEPIILHEQPNEGVTSIMGKLERYSGVDCAVVLFTADDVGSEKGKELQPRARQNVVFEAGLFLGKLGPKKVIILYEESVELPGDLDGCVYTKADENGGWKEKLRMEFDTMGIQYTR